MNNHSRLTINIEIDEIQTEVIYATNLNELYTGIENFFNTYHFTDPLVKLKIKERIVTSFKNLQKLHHSQLGLTNHLTQSDAFQNPVKEVTKTPAQLGKTVSRLFQTDLKRASENVQFKGFQMEEPLRNKSANKPIAAVNSIKHSSVLKPSCVPEAVSSTKRAIVPLKAKPFINRQINRQQSGYTKNGKFTTMKLSKGKVLSGVFPKLAQGITMSTVNDIRGLAQQTDAAQGRGCATPRMGATKSSVGVGANEIGFKVNVESRSIDQHPFQDEITISNNPNERNITQLINCATDRGPKVSSSFTRPQTQQFDLQSDPERSIDHMTSSWVFQRNKQPFERERTHASAAQFKFDNVYRPPHTHKQTNSDCDLFNPDIDLPNFDLKNTSPYVYRRRTQADPPLGLYSDHRKSQPTIMIHETQLSPRTQHSRGDTIDKMSKEEQGLKYFLKINAKNEKLIRIFRAFDEKHLGYIAPSNFNLSGINSEVLRNFKPLITHVYESANHPEHNYMDFLQLIYKYQISF